MSLANWDTAEVRYFHYKLKELTTLEDDEGEQYDTFQNHISLEAQCFNYSSYVINFQSPVAR